MPNFDELRIVPGETLTDEKWNGIVDQIQAIRQLFITEDGKLGLGTGNNQVKAPLHILIAQEPAGSLLAEENGLLLGTAGTSTYKWIQSYGGSLSLNMHGNNVGIGTNKPAAPLTVQNNNKAQIEFKRDRASGAIEQNQEGGAMRLQNPDNDTLIQLRTYGNSYFNGGNVGIGTDNPQHKLQVVGQVYATNLRSSANTVVEQDLIVSRDLRVNRNADFRNDLRVREDARIDKALTVRGAAVMFDAFTVWKDMAAINNVVIGTTLTGTTLKGKLHIQGHLEPMFYLPAHTYIDRDVTKPNLIIGGPSAGRKEISIYATHGVVSSRLHVFSDARIKTIHGISDRQKDLDILKKIEITDYSYRDPISRGDMRHKKVIGQQIAKVFPQAVSNSLCEIVPDIMKEATAQDGWVVLEAHNLKKGEKVRIILEDGHKDLIVVAAEPNQFQVNEAITGEVFVYGREVPDFHTVDYEAISMLHVSATQELAVIIEKQVERFSQLTSILKNVDSRLKDLEKMVSATQMKNMKLL